MIKLANETGGGNTVEPRHYNVHKDEIITFQTHLFDCRIPIDSHVRGDTEDLEEFAGQLSGYRIVFHEQHTWWDGPTGNVGLPTNTEATGGRRRGGGSADGCLALVRGRRQNLLLDFHVVCGGAGGRGGAWEEVANGEDLETLMVGPVDWGLDPTGGATCGR